MAFTFWFDLENAPDVLFFEPLATELRRLGHTVHITSRAYSNVPELAEIYGIPSTILGKHGGEKKLGKIVAGLNRSRQMIRWARGKNIDLAVGFGSQPMAVACGAWLKMPNITVDDYEHTIVSVLNRYCDLRYVPEEVPLQVLLDKGTPEKKLRFYTGLKEEVYTGVYEPDLSLKQKLKLPEDKIIVTMRPPATLAHYHDHTGEVICNLTLEHIAQRDDVVCVLMTRDNDHTFDEYLKYDNIQPLPFPVKGLDLLAISDLVISGGGTMVREAVALGIPAYSTFTGEQGAVDLELSAQGRLTLVRREEDADKIILQKRQDYNLSDYQRTDVRDFFVAEFIRLAQEGQA